MMKTFLCICWFSTISCFAQQPELVTHANTFLSLLDTKLKAKAQYPFDNDERFNWGFVPRSRNGVSLHDLNDQQKSAAFALLKASLSTQGYQKATGIVELEGILREVEGRSAGDSYRDPLNYYFSIFGNPSATAPWGWRFEGHHLALNFCSVSGLIESGTPSFWGSNPAVVPKGEKRGTRVLKQEIELGFALVNSFSEDQLKTARFSETAPSEIFSSNSRKAEQLRPEGILYTAMNDAQRKIFLQLLQTFVGNYELGFSDKLTAKIKKAGIEKLSFAWAGSMKPGAGHYYRIQGPMLLIEYDNTQNNANHVHTTVRDLTNDFGEDILREHYKKEHGK
jgi:hypothetical protein